MERRRSRARIEEATLRRSRRGRGLLAGGVALGLALACARSEPEVRGVLFITLDTTRADYVGSLGGPEGVTPKIDALARRSTLFTHAVSETNVTNPSHVTMFSGLRAIEHGVHSNSARLPQTVRTLPAALRERGWRTAGFAAARHAGAEAGWTGFEHLPAVSDVLDAAEVTDRVRPWLRAHAHERFFVWVHYFDPHALYQPPPALVRRFYQGDPRRGVGPRIAQADYFRSFHRRPLGVWLGAIRDTAYPKALYAAEIHYADRKIGRLLRELESVGRAGDTAIVIAGDHGESLGEHEIYYDHAGLYEPQLRIPLVIHVPGAPARIWDRVVTTLDLAPTLEDLLGVSLGPGRAGRSLLPIVRSGVLPSPPEPEIVIHEHAHNAAVAVRRGDWKLILTHPTYQPQEWDPAPQLFDLSRDPGEQRNLAGFRPEIVAELSAWVQPWTLLGVNPDAVPGQLDPEAAAALRALGYLD